MSRPQTGVRAGRRNTASWRTLRQRLTRVAAVVLALVVLTPTAARAEDYVSISGAGSTWSAIALQQWAVDVQQNDLTVNYQDVGSSQGRTQYILGTVDYAVSEIPFQVGETTDRPYSLMPVVAGGTSFMYHLTVAGKRVDDLRLSGETIAKIFTGVITNWNDPAITADYGKQLPSIAIQPVLRSDGSGTTAQFTLYMSKQYPTLWNAFCKTYAGLEPPCGLTSQYPQFGNSTSQNGSNGVANYVAANYGEGAITYVEYAYAKNLGFPVVKVLNAKGYYTLPTASNVAVALTKAAINPDTLEQELTGVYNNDDPRTYPLSSYSYMIVPIDTTAPMNAEKGKSLSTFINYFLCAGQQKAELLGYSPLPINLVQEGFKVVRQIPGFVAPPDSDLAACNNPTFQGGENVLLKNAPFPSECDKVGSSPDCVVGGVTPPPGSGGTTAPPTGGGNSSAAPGTGSAGGTTLTPEQIAAGEVPADATVIDPDTGEVVLAGAGTDTGVAVASVQDLGAFKNASAQTKVVYGLTAIELLLVVMIPPLMAMVLRRRRSSTARDDAGPTP